ncbi:hypothetical protein WKV47_15185, partial [Salmonella enterica]
MRILRGLYVGKVGANKNSAAMGAVAACVWWEDYCLITALYFAFRSPAVDAVALMLPLLVGGELPLLV